MKPFKFILTFLCFAAFLFQSCDNDDDELTTNQTFVLESDMLGCSKEESFDFDDDLVFNFEFFGNDYFAYRDLDGITIRDGIGGEVVFRDSIEANEMVAKDGKLLICAPDGVFEIGQDLELKKLLDVECFDLVKNSDERILLAGNGGTPLDPVLPNQIYELNLSDNSVTNFTEAYPTNDCPQIEQIELGGNGKLWARNCDNDIVEFKDGNFVTTHLSNELAGTGVNKVWDVFIAPYGNDLVAVFKRSLHPYIISLYRGGEWVTIKDFSLSDELSDKERFVTLANVQTIFVKDDFIYLATIEGLVQLSLTRPFPLLEDDFEVNQDPRINTQIITNVYQRTDNEIYFVSSFGTVTKFNCP